MFSAVVDQNVNVRQRKIIFCAGFIEIPVIDTYPILSIFFGDWNNIGQPNRVLRHLHQSRLDMIGDLLFNL